MAPRALNILLDLGGWTYGGNPREGLATVEGFYKYTDMCRYAPWGRWVCRRGDDRYLYFVKEGREDSFTWEREP